MGRLLYRTVCKDAVCVSGQCENVTIASG